MLVCHNESADRVSLIMMHRTIVQFHRFLILLLFLLLNHSKGSETAPPEQPYDISKISARWEHRLYLLGNESSVCKFMQEEKNSNVRSETDTTYKLMSTLFDAFLAHRRNNPSKACNLPEHHRWSQASGAQPRVFQIAEINQDCHSYIHIDEAVKRKELEAWTLHNLTNIIRTGRSAFRNATVEAPFPKDGSWYENEFAPYESTARKELTIGQKCDLDAAFAFLINSRVYMRVAVSDNYGPLYMTDFQRQVVVEYVPSDFSAGLKMIHRHYQPFVPPTEQNASMEYGTTLLMLIDGQFKLATQPSLFTDSYGALKRAAETAEDATDRGNDALTVSNIAILALPLAMNLVPVAFVADLTTAGLVIYIIFTDILSTIPFLAKGVELVLLGRPRGNFATAFFAGNESLAQIEVWSALCQSEPKFRNVGIAFIVTALVSMITGVLLEVGAMKYVYRRRIKMQSSARAHGPFGPALMERSRLGLFGASNYEEGANLLGERDA